MFSWLVNKKYLPLFFQTKCIIGKVKTDNIGSRQTTEDKEGPIVACLLRLSHSSWADGNAHRMKSYCRGGMDLHHFKNTS